MIPLPLHVIECLFRLFQGNYGHKFTSMYSTGVNGSGIDLGLENAKQVWAEELACFSDNLYAIWEASNLTDPSHPPTAREFKALCSRVPPPFESVLPYKHTAEDKERNQAGIANALRALTPRNPGEIDTHWPGHPRSQRHLKFIFEAGENDHRFRPYINAMISDGICTADGKLLQVYRDGQFSPC